MQESRHKFLDPASLSKINNAMKRTPLILVVLVMSGCATSPVKVSESQQVSSDRLLSGYPPLAEPTSLQLVLFAERHGILFWGCVMAAILVSHNAQLFF